MLKSFLADNLDVLPRLSFLFAIPLQAQRKLWAQRHPRAVCQEMLTYLVVKFPIKGTKQHSYQEIRYQMYENR